MSKQAKPTWPSASMLLAIGLGAMSVACVRHSEEALTWCGPATAQMIIENDTKSGCPASILQEDLWTRIEGARVDSSWDTDPAGMSAALKQSCTGWNWIPLKNTDETVFMRQLTWFMQHYEYPAAVVLNTLPHNSDTAHGEHWVYVVGAGTTPAATAPLTTPVTVDWVIYVDPAPPVFGDAPILEVVSGSTWFTTLQPVNKPASADYHGRYVASIEPPEVTGTAIAREEPRAGTIRPMTGVAEAALRQLRKLANDPRAVEVMRKHDPARVLKAYGLPEPTVTANLRRAKALEPLLVNREGAAYYLVPITFEGAQSAGLARGAVAINAYDGSFQEVGLFRATKYLGKRQIIERARGLAPLAKARALEADLTYSAATPTAHRLMPLWRVTGDGKTFDFDPMGNQVRSPVPLPVEPSPDRPPAPPVTHPH